MTQLQDLQFPIDRSIFGELLACIPADWARARLVARSDTDGAATTMQMQIDAMGQSGIALVSDALQDRVRELFLLNRRFDTRLRGIAYTYSRNADGRWLFNGDYDYG